MSPQTATGQAPLSFTISQSLLKFMFIESVVLSNHLILYHPFLLLPSIFPSIRVFSSESTLCIKWSPSVAGKGTPLPGPETGLLSNTQKRIVEGDTCADKARDFIGKGRPGGEQEGKGTQENCSVPWLAVSGFYGNGISFPVVFSQSF